MSIRRLVVAAATASLGIPSMLGRAQGGGPAIREAIYRAPQYQACDPDSPDGIDAMWSLVVHREIRDQVPAAWSQLGLAVPNPQSVNTSLDLARCYYTFYRDLSRRRHLDDVERWLTQAANLMQRERAAGLASPAIPSTAEPMRAAYGGEPKKTKDRAAEYPKAARREHIEGLVFIEATIDQSGNVRATHVIGSIPALDRSAEDAVRKWKFAPTVVGGRRVPIIKIVSVKFGDNARTTPADGIDLVRFFYTHGDSVVAEGVLEQTIAAVRKERALIVTAPETSMDRLLGATADIVRANGGPSSPTVIAHPNPRYTAEAMQAKIQGNVEMDAIVLVDGRVGPLRVTKSLDPRLGLDEEAMAAAKQWKFKPATDARGEPIPAIVTIEMTFRLH